jgi:hypothetical protein
VGPTTSSILLWVNRHTLKPCPPLDQSYGSSRSLKIKPHGLMSPQVKKSMWTSIPTFTNPLKMKCWGTPPEERGITCHCEWGVDWPPSGRLTPLLPPLPFFGLHSNKHNLGFINLLMWKAHGFMGPPLNHNKIEAHPPLHSWLKDSSEEK